MTIQEFSNAFDTLLNSYGNKANFGEETSRQNVAFDEYEKSQFLTIAQEEAVIDLYTGRNLQRESFESSEEVRRYLANLIVAKTLEPITNTNGLALGGDKSRFFTLPIDVWFLTYESVKVDSGECGEKEMKVYPVRQDEYQNIKDNPFRGANDRKALRLDLSEGNIELVCKYPVKSYYIRYIKKPNPIILVDLPDDLTINGKSQAMGCKLHEALHQRILEKAVMYALQSRGYSSRNTNDNN